MPKKKIKVGDKFGKWEVIADAPSTRYKCGQVKTNYLCRCECGTERIVRGAALASGNSQSCGCATKKDLIGHKFNHLIVLSYAGQARTARTFNCRCDCGNTIVLDAYSITSGKRKDCGCLNRQRGAKVNNRRLYCIFTGMKSRCYNPNATGYKNYGGRGITICDEWLADFFAFKDWATSHGYADELTIDRIDNEKGYCPNNCRWVTRADQNRNKRNVRTEVIVNA